MDENANLIRDGKDGQALRKANWVDLVPESGNEGIGGSSHRAQLMRQCWRAILKVLQVKRDRD